MEHTIFDYLTNQNGIAYVHERPEFAYDRIRNLEDIAQELADQLRLADVRYNMLLQKYDELVEEIKRWRDL